MQDYKEQKTARPGLFAVRCAASGECWVGVSRNLDRQQNGLWFGLRMGSPTYRAMQAAWSAHGEASFAYEVLEAIEDEDLSEYLLKSRLKEREAHWVVATGGVKLF